MALRECAEWLRRAAPGLYTLLSAVARHRYGAPLERLGERELLALVRDLLPGAYEQLLALLRLCA